MRIATLLPSATEIVCALGAIDDLVAVSHDCDYPPDIRTLPRVTATPIDLAWPSEKIDDEVVRLRGEGRPVIGLDAEALRRLRPDLLITQSLCDVCAVSDGEAFRVAAALDPAPRVLALEAADVAGVARDIEAVGAAIGRMTEARALVDGMYARLRGATRAMDAAAAMTYAGTGHGFKGPMPTGPTGTGRIAQQRPTGGRPLREVRGTRDVPDPPDLPDPPGLRRGPATRSRVLCLEWLAPPYVAGHWVPELVAFAGGVDAAAAPGERSRRVSWEELAALDADIIIVMLCGFGVERARVELNAMADPAARAVLESAPVWLLDGGAYTSRPGPRIAEGAERIASAIRGESAPGLDCWRPR